MAVPSWVVPGTDQPAQRFPAVHRGSTDNSLLQLALGYKRPGQSVWWRKFASGTEWPARAESDMGHGSVMFGGQPGLVMAFSDSMGAEIAWLLPCAVVGLLATLWLTRKAPRTDRTRSALLLWGGWLVVTAVVFSFMKGIMHPYYTVALAPAVAALVGTCSRELWRRKQLRSARAARLDDRLDGNRGVPPSRPGVYVAAVAALGIARRRRRDRCFPPPGLCLDRWTTQSFPRRCYSGSVGRGLPRWPPPPTSTMAWYPTRVRTWLSPTGSARGSGLKLADSQRLPRHSD